MQTLASYSNRHHSFASLSHSLYHTLLHMTQTSYLWFSGSKWCKSHLLEEYHSTLDVHDFLQRAAKIISCMVQWQTWNLSPGHVAASAPHWAGLIFHLWITPACRTALIRYACHAKQHFRNSSTLCTTVLLHQLWLKFKRRLVYWMPLTLISAACWARCTHRKSIPRSTRSWDFDWISSTEYHGDCCLYCSKIVHQCTSVHHLKLERFLPTTCSG